MKKLKSILQFLWDNLKWNLLRVIGWIIYPTYIYFKADRIWAEDKRGFTWLFLNDGKFNEKFTICTRRVAPDWYLQKKGFDESHLPNALERWFYAVKWNAFRNPADNYLNYIIGFSGWDMYKLINNEYIELPEHDKTNKWFYQFGNYRKYTLRFYWSFTTSWRVFGRKISIALGSNRHRYASHLKPQR